LDGLSGLSLAVGVTIAEALQVYCDDAVELKWPNDIRAQQRKLGGVLIELSGEAGGPCQVVVGMGINVHMHAAHVDAIDQAWISLDQVSRAPVTRTQLIAQLIERLALNCQQFERDGFAPFCSSFNQRDEFFGKRVSISGVNEVLEGCEAGVDERGSLLLNTGQGQRKIIAGEVSLRAKN
jgi:BirA family biotin operon repressor/biotin-[acetyl-CoA-carboxylase] ligase